MVTGVPELPASWGPFPLMNVARVHLTLLATAAAPTVSANWSPGHFLHAVGLQSPHSSIHQTQQAERCKLGKITAPRQKQQRDAQTHTLCFGGRTDGTVGKAQS